MSPNPLETDDKLGNTFGNLLNHVDNTRNQCDFWRGEEVGVKTDCDL